MALIKEQPRCLSVYKLYSIILAVLLYVLEIPLNGSKYKQNVIARGSWSMFTAFSKADSHRVFTTLQCCGRNAAAKICRAAKH